LQTASRNSEQLNDLPNNNSFLVKKPILKKKALSEVLLQKSISTSSLLSQAAAAVQAKQSLPPQKPRSRLAGIPSPQISRESVQLQSSKSSSSCQSPDQGEKQHIRFNDNVEQFIAVDIPDADINDDESLRAAGHDSDSSSDDGLLFMRNKPMKRKPLSGTTSKSASDSKIIAILEPTTLKYRTDSPSVLESPSHSVGPNSWNRGNLSPSYSRETLRPSNPSRNFLLDEDDDEDDIDWAPSEAFNYRRDRVFDSKGKSSALQRTPSGMLMPYDEEYEATQDTGLLGNVVDTFNTAKDIAHVIWNVGWRKSQHEEFDMPTSNPSADLPPAGRPMSTQEEKPRSPVPGLGIVGPKTLHKAIQQLDVHRLEALLAHNFSNVAKEGYAWLHEILDVGYSYKEIAELLTEEEKFSPWILTDHPNVHRSTILENFHRPNCVHQGVHELADRAEPDQLEICVSILDASNSDLSEAELISREVASACGLAGIVPTSVDFDKWTGLVRFNNLAVASVTYGQDPSTPSTIDTSIRRVEATLERLLGVLSWLQQHHLCCSSFTTLKLSVKDNRVEALRIPFTLVERLHDSVLNVISNIQSSKLRRAAFQASVEILDLIYGTEGHRPKQQEPEDVAVVHQCALATQSICLGLLSYSKAHSGPIQPFFLSKPLNRIDLHGIIPYKSHQPSYWVQLVNLSCLGQMTKNSAIVFTSAEVPPSQKYDILASPEDLIDTWGPGRFVVDRLSIDSRQLCAIEIGGGVITPTAENPAIFHWEKGRFDNPPLKTSFDLHPKILVAATTHNSSCPLDQVKSWPICLDTLDILGTRQDHWRRSQQQIGIQASQYVGAQFNVTWIKQDGVTIKDLHLNNASDTLRFQILESLWGLQISLCTGVAKRVPVREMLADVTEVYVAKRLPLPPEWKDLLENHNIIDELRGPNLELWLGALAPDLQSSAIRMFRYVLDVLRDTGYDTSSDEFVIAWPFPDDPFHCFRVKCKGHHLWTRALADSNYCATFAYITPKCLEADEYTCQRCTAIQWQQTVSLDTAVCQHRSNTEPRASGTLWSLEVGNSYWIGKPGGELMAKVLQSKVPLGTRLSITRSGIPEGIRLRMGKVRRIRERQQRTDANATPVLMLTSK
jgi:hypothetical protein